MYLLSVFIAFVNFLFLFLCGQYLGKKYSILISLFGMLMAMLLALFMFYEVCLSGHVCILNYSLWVSSELLIINFGFLFDSLTCIMLLMVNVISFFVHVFSVGYMSKDPHLIRFLSYLSLFTFFMCLLISAGNMIQMFLG